MSVGMFAASCELSQRSDFDRKNCLAMLGSRFCVHRHVLGRAKSC